MSKFLWLTDAAGEETLSVETIGMYVIKPELALFGGMKFYRAWIDDHEEPIAKTTFVATSIKGVKSMVERAVSAKMMQRRFTI